MTGRAVSLFQPWAGLVAGLLGAAFAHQFGADGTFDDCQRFAPLPLLLVSAFCIVACLGGAYASLQVLRRYEEETSPRVISVVSVGFALLAVLAILLPMLATMILPPCFE